MMRFLQFIFLLIVLSFSGCGGCSSGTTGSGNQTIPAAPAGLSATGGDVQVFLSWTASAGATGYRVKRATTSGGVYTQVSAPTSTSYTDTGRTNDMTYYYVVSAVNTAGESDNSSEISVMPVAIITITSVPPTAYVLPGRTYDPNEALTPPTGSGSQYHVALTGSDSDPGTAAQPFRTIQHGFDALTNGGDTLHIHGGLYRERVALYSKNAPDGNPFIIRPAGDGEVILDCSSQITGWTSQGGNIYLAHTGFAVAAVVVDNQPLYKELSFTGLQADPTVTGVPTEYRYYFDADAQNLYVRVAGGYPGVHDTGVISDNTDENGLNLYECNNYVVYGMTERFAGGRGIIGYGCNNFRVERCKVVFNGHTGLTTLRSGTNHHGDNARLIKNLVHFNFMQNWPRGNNDYVWGGWGGGMGIQATPYALVEGIISMKNGGEGILTYDGEGGTTFRNNVSADNWSVLFYYDDLPDGLIEGNLAIAHKPNLADTYGNGLAPTSEDYSRAIRLQRAVGIVTADEGYGNGARLNNVTIRNNVIINARCGSAHIVESSVAATSGLKNVKFVNNTILIPSDRYLPDEDAGQIGGISIPYNNGNNTGSCYENNIIIGGDADTYAMNMVAEQAIPNLFLGLTIDHNLIYVPANTTPFLWGGNWGTRYTHAQWLALAGGTGHGTGDVLTAPNLVNVNTDSALDKKPQAGSPAIDTGVATPTFVTVDFEGVARPQGAGWDMGAFENTP